jgi:hypothetical protein
MPNDEYEATSFYLKVLCKSIIKSGSIYEKIFDVKSISKTDIVLTINPKMFIKAWFHNRKQKQIFWFQGIVPEEQFMVFKKHISRVPRYIIHTLFEIIILMNAKLLFFVSDAMQKHFIKKYNFYKGNNCFIMPCFNQKLNSVCFNSLRYKEQNFVYAGSLSEWQCIEETLLLFKAIKQHFPEASLTLLTKEKEKAFSLLKKHKLSGVVVKYIPYQQLNDELQKYKFGFLIRKDIAINNVATPTKMNSYMANGIIPIYSNVIEAFHKNMSGCKYIVTVEDNIKIIIDKIAALSNIDIECIYNEYANIFSNYYNDELYVYNISMLFSRFFE